MTKDIERWIVGLGENPEADFAVIGGVEAILQFELRTDERGAAAHTSRL